MGAQPRRRRCLPRRRLAWVPPTGRRSLCSRYSRPRAGRSTPTVAAEGAVWLPRRVAGPVVEGTALVVVASVVVGSTVVVGAVVVGSTVVVGAVVVGCTVVVGAVTVGWVVVAPDVDGAWVVVAPPVVAGVPAVAGGVGVAGPLRSSGTVSGMVVDGAGEVVGSREAVLVDAEVGAGSAGDVGGATPGARRGGGGWWGTRVAEATTAARTAAVNPKVRSSSRQGRRGGARCRACRIGILHRPGSTRSSG
jgi:hypothetical protein